MPLILNLKRQIAGENEFSINDWKLSICFSCFATFTIGIIKWLPKVCAVKIKILKPVQSIHNPYKNISRG